MRILILILMLPSIIFSQNEAEITWSEAEKHKLKYVDLIEFRNNYFLLKSKKPYVSAKQGSSITQYDDQMKVISAIDLPLGKKTSSIKIINVDEKLWVISQASKGNDDTILFNQLKDDLSFSDEHTKGLKFEDIYSYTKTAYIDQSDNNLYTAVAMRLDSKKNEGMAYKFYLLDQQMNIVDEGVFNLSCQPEGKTPFFQLVIDNDGNIFGITPCSSSSNNHLAYWKYTSSTKKSLTKEIKMTKTILNAHLSKKDNEILLSGAFGQKSKKKNPMFKVISSNGLFSSFFSLNNPIIPKPKYSPFPVPFSNVEFRISESHFWGENEIIISGELTKIKISKKTSTSRKKIEDSLSPSEIVNTSVGPGLVNCIDRKGNFNWTVPLPKVHNKKSNIPYNSIHSHQLVLTSDEAIAIYNNLSEPSLTKFPFPTATMISRINRAGKMTIGEELFQFSKYDVLANPEKISVLKDNRVFIYGTKKSKFRVGIYDLSN